MNSVKPTYLQVQTDRTIPDTKPDIKIRGNTCKLIDVVISGDKNAIKK